MDNIVQLRTFMEDGAYDKAVALLPSIREKSVKGASDLMLLAKAYGKCADFVHADKIFKRAYKIRSSKLLYRDIIEIAIECGKAEEAEAYYEQYSKLAPGDIFYLNTLKYKIEKLKGADPASLVGVLKELNEYEYTPEWAYELVKVYRKAGMQDECIAELEKIISTFEPDSMVVVKSQTLLSYYNGEISAEDIKQRGRKRDETEHAEAVGTEVHVETEASEKEINIEVKDSSVSEDGGQKDNSANDLTARDATNAVPEKTEVTEKEESKDTSAPSDTEIYVAAADAEIEEELEEQTEIEKAVMTPEAATLFAPSIEFTSEDLRDSKAKKIIDANQIDVEEACKNYFRISEIRHQIFKCLDLAVSERNRIFLCITGEAGSGRTTLGARLVRLLFLMGILNNDRVARVDAERLNNFGMSDFKDMLSKYSVLIENAGKLDSRSVEFLNSVSADKKSGTCIILEDNSRNINALLRQELDLREVVNNRIHLPKYSAEEIVGFAYDLCKDNEYELSENAADKLKKIIESEKSGEAEKLDYVISIVKRAVAAADERCAPGILKMAAEAAFSEECTLVVTENDITL